ncbi:hypothetical protein EDB80DRAFT_872799 [Ilyonectria destructans]|nr:hypothetical protein EDB80DRAFT_872799 [Ilyonectria destructans]
MFCLEETMRQSFGHSYSSSGSDASAVPPTILSDANPPRQLRDLGLHCAGFRPLQRLEPSLHRQHRRVRPTGRHPYPAPMMEARSVPNKMDYDDVDDSKAGYTLLPHQHPHGQGSVSEPYLPHEPWNTYQPVYYQQSTVH